MTDQRGDSGDDREEERSPDEERDEQNQYGGGDTEIDPVEQTERVEEDDDAEDGTG